MAALMASRKSGKSLSKRRVIVFSVCRSVWTVCRHASIRPSCRKSRYTARSAAVRCAGCGVGLGVGVAHGSGEGVAVGVADGVGVAVAVAVGLGVGDGHGVAVALAVGLAALVGPWAAGAGGAVAASATT